ncbi:hypothetical protein HPB52_012021 [Rhipicephalus sanguineus]|uniref:Uncharacterized protein n=1 Tax=Rhipicephalus sanguineus TaxID=34632 RepID=A0A9D4QEK7_RHISA|nr:hypothetical protein HPB52_012021 [Rhipicephalus sanguineus]
MASVSKQNAGISILTPEYADLLRSLSAISTPSLNDVTNIFKEFRRSLDARKPKPSSKPSTSLSTSSGASKKRGGKSAARATAVSDGADFDGCASGDGNLGFERSCTWEPDENRCWIVSDLDLWNRILSCNCVELREYKCVTHIFLDMSMTTIERYILWHAIKTGAGGVKRLEIRPCFLNICGLTALIERTVCCQAIATMMNLTFLRLSDIYLTDEMAHTIGVYVEQTTALTILQLIQAVANDTNAGVFLDHLARNRSVKSLRVQEFFVIARQGQALADVVRNHVTLQEIEARGPPDFRPSALLAAAVQSPSLRSLTVHDCLVDAEDIQAMASALTVTRAPIDFTAEMLPPLPTSRLRQLTFMNCVLVRLKLFKCGLGEIYAARAAYRLLYDKRLRELDLEDNDFTTDALSDIIGTLKVNKTLEALVVNMTNQHTEGEVASLFRKINKTDAFSRIMFHWVNPRASDLLQSIHASHTPSVCLNLDEREDAAACLQAIADNRNLDVVCLEFTELPEGTTVQRLTHTLATSKSLRKVSLSSSLPESDVVLLFRALEKNRTISVIEFRSITFQKRTARALGQMVERNRKIIFLTVVVADNDPVVDCTVQVRSICRELKEAILRNRFLMNVAVKIGLSERSHDLVIMDALRSNTVLLNRAVRFVNGSMEKVDALAFDTLQHCESVPLRMLMDFDICRESALEKVAEARQRLVFNYFVLTGVVEAAVVCERSRKAKKKKTTLDMIGRRLQARICSYLSLADVMDF